MKLNYPLLALALGAFGIGVTEFTPMGMLPLIAGDLHVSIPAAGLLISAYAIGVMVGAPVMTLLFARTARRTLLVGLMGLFTVGNLLAALSDSYATLLVARIVTSFNHGAFFGVGAVVAAGVVPPERRASAVAAMFSGLTVATIGGVPLASAVGQALGWRAAFWGIAAIGLLTMVSLRAALPELPADRGADMRTELRVLRRGPVMFALLLTVLGFSAMFTVFTYLVPLLHREAGASSGFVTAMLVVFGIGLAVGNGLGGRWADRSVDATLVGGLGAVAVLLLVFAVVMHSEWATAPLVFLWGAASFLLVAPLQMRIMSEASDAPNLASAMNIGAFNLGNAIGAAVGGEVLDLGFGYPAVALAAAVLSAGALMLVMLGSGRRSRAVLAAGR
ncbi:MFS transporter [Acetobacteraceae bacterium KSS8]|uniref:MFS transporter n=1 Tax=Endosaccharibacter trunci TaxID=2812733 RepID=A0ABT1W4F8_9PROT|nr:MFS transporter [Acetobacteraceae bacterium KSS8]